MQKDLGGVKKPQEALRSRVRGSGSNRIREEMLESLRNLQEAIKLSSPA